MTWIWRIAVAAAICFVVPGAGQAQSVPVINVPKTQFLEKFYDRRDHALFGLMKGWQVGDPQARLSEAVVFVSGIQATDKTICITIDHVGGGYWAQANIPNPGKGTSVMVRLPSTLFSKRRDILNEDLGLLVQASASGQCSETGPILLAGWGRAADTRLSSVYVSWSSGTTMRVWVDGGGEAKDCIPLDGGTDASGKVRQEFNARCPIDLGPNCHPEAKVELVIDNHDTRQQVPPTVIRRGCAP